jgi:hypothetical protein
VEWDSASIQPSRENSVTPSCGLLCAGPVHATLVLHVLEWLSVEGTLHIPQTVVFKSKSTLLFLPDSPSKILPHICFCKHDCYMVNESSAHLDLVAKELPNMYCDVEVNPSQCSAITNRKVMGEISIAK